MNKIYRFNRPLTIASLVAAALLATANPLQALDPNALPTGGQVVAGQANISQAGSAMTVNQQTDRMIANWNTFNIGRNASVAFQQPGASSVALNRIFDQNPSQIFGSLSANGQVFLLNTAGVYFGPTAQVDVGGLVASSLNLSNENFLAGKYHFENTGIAGSIINQGQIRTAEGGYVAFLSPGIINEGTISTPGGTTALAAGDKVSLDFTGDRLVTFTVDQGAIDAQIKNKGLIKADGGLVMMTAKAADELTRAVVNNEGVVEAQTLENRSGRILLLADMESGETIVGGRLDASAPYGGDGGFIETSAAKVTIRDGAQITTFAPNGKTGTWLIDPNDFTIAASGGDITGSQLSTNLGGGNVTILSSNGATAGNGDIFVNDAVSWSSHTLTLTAARDININAVMTASGDSTLTMNTAGSVKVGMNPDAGGFKGRVDFPGRSGIGFLTINGDDYTVINDVNAVQAMGSGLSGEYALGANIDASSTDTWNSGEGFAPIGDSSTQFTGTFDGLGHTISGLTINRPATDYVGLFGWTDGAAISNVGITGGSVTGKGYVGGLVGYNNNSPITNSYATGAVLATGEVSTSPVPGIPFTGVGGLVGGNFNSSTITNSYATGEVTGEGDGAGVGGLVGGNDNSTITNSYATGAVTGSMAVGGLVGGNLSNTDITNSYATGAVTGEGNYVGGLVGENYDSIITNSYATGKVTGEGDVGGLVGYNNSGTITNSYATGPVTGSSSVGGLVGAKDGATTINSFWDTETSGQETSAGGTGKTTAEMMQQATYPTGDYTDWDFTDTWYMIEGNTRPFLRSEYSTTITNAHQLQLMQLDLGASYTLGNNIDMSELAQASGLWNTSTGFVPIGDSSTQFTGTFDGLGHTISGLTIDRPTTDYDVGLFGYTKGAAISNVGITGGSVTGKSYVGGLVGWNYNSTITNSYATGKVSAIGDYTESVGGLVGYNDNSTITNSYATGAVTGEGYSVGGLVGWNNNSTIENSYATGEVTGSGFEVGGLVGYNDNSTITNSYATGAVTGEGYSVGGLVGENYQSGIENSYATGKVTGRRDYVGGLVGKNKDSTIEDSHATGKVSATGADAKNVGGLVGYNESSTIEDSHATGEVSATGANAKNVGGLVGKNEDSTIEDSHATGEVTGRAAVGGLVGYNESSTITNSYAKTGAVTGIRDYVGGLVGINTSSSTITNSYATGAVWAIGEGYVGGLVGKNEDSTIEDSHATGSVTGKSYVGGLVGYNENSPITNSYAATGEVKGEGNYVGGLVGSNLSSSTITNSSAAGEVTGGYYVGGLVGWNEGSTITNSSATGEVKRGGDRVGGLVGSNLSSSTITNSSAAGEVTGRAAVGGLVGYNESSTIEEDSHATGNVTGSYYVGGLVGHNNLSTITNSYATGAVLATGVVLPSPLPDDIPLTGVGGLVGYNENSTITNSHATGDVTGEAIGAGVGGLVGGNDSSTITNSYAKGVVTGNIAVGGLVGANVSNTIITESYATGKVEGYMAVGGLVGANLSSTDITNSYATGAVEGDNAVGGLVGAHNDGSTITNSYATGKVEGDSDVGGLVGYNSSDSTITNSFWDKETSGQSGSAGGEGLTTDKMKKLTTFAGWDIDDAGGTDEVWRIYEDKTYPLLRNFLTPATATVSGDLTKVYDASTTVSGGSHTWDITVDESKIYGTAVYTSESKNVGNWQVTLTGLFSEQQGYDIDTVNGAVTITPYDLKVTGLSASNKVYDAGTVATLTGTAAITKLGTDDVTLGGTAEGAFANKNVGTGKAVTVTGNSISGTDAGNYNLIQQAGLTADITKADLTVTANDISKTYGQEITFAGTEFTGNGLVGGETIGLVQLASSGASATAVVAGSPYVITASDASGGTFLPANYNITYQNGALTVNKAALTVTANDDKKTFDNLPYTGGNGVVYAGFVNNETAADLGGTLGYGGSSQGAIQGGTYNIDPLGLTSVNYALTFKNGILTIEVPVVPVPVVVDPVAINRQNSNNGNDPAAPNTFALGAGQGSQNIGMASVMAESSSIDAVIYTPTFSAPVTLSSAGQTMTLTVGGATSAGPMTDVGSLPVFTSSGNAAPALLGTFMLQQSGSAVSLTPTAPSGTAPSAPAASGLTGDRSVPFTLALDNGMTLQMTASVTADGVLVVSAPDAGGNIDVQQAILIGVQVVRQALNVELSNLSSALFVRN